MKNGFLDYRVQPPQVKTKIVGGKITFYVEKPSLKRYNAKSSGKRQTKPAGKLERKAREGEPVATKQEHTPNPTQAPAQEIKSYEETAPESGTEQEDRTDYMQRREYETPLKIYGLVSRDEKNTILRKYYGNLARALKDVEMLDEERRERKADGQRLSSGNSGNGHDNLGEITFIDYSQEIPSAAKTRLRGHKTLNKPVYGVPHQIRPSVELPPVEGVLSPDDPRYDERLKMLKGTKYVSTTDSGNGKGEIIISKVETPTKAVYNLNDLQDSPPEQFDKMVDKILHGEMGFTMLTHPSRASVDEKTAWTKTKEIVTESLAQDIVTESVTNPRASKPRGRRMKRTGMKFNDRKRLWEEGRLFS